MVTCILLVAGHASRLILDLGRDARQSYLQGTPKALLPGPHSKRILDHWWIALKNCKKIGQVFLVTNADNYKHFERWASSVAFPLENILNDGSSMPTNALGAVSDLELVVRSKNVASSDCLVIAGDMLFQVGKFNVEDVLLFWESKPDSDVAVYYKMEPEESTTMRGILEIEPSSSKVVKFLEKPLPAMTCSRCASVVFYGFRSRTLQLLQTYVKTLNHLPVHHRSLGCFMQYIVNNCERDVYGYLVSTGFQMIGDVSLVQYRRWLSAYDSASSPPLPGPRGFTARAFARVGIMGNPSDGFFGKTIAMTIRNFWADVTIEESSTLRLLPNPLSDPTEFGSLSDLHGTSSRDGYLGGLRLLQATCKMFYHYCTQNSIALSERNFTLSYDTNIPRQVGLAGSSAIVTATLHALMAFYELPDDAVPQPLRPQLVLNVETDELFINAGLQDRVVQEYEGLIYMDFSEALMMQNGYGAYTRLQVPGGTEALPKFFLAYKPEASDSGRIHSDVRERWSRGDCQVVAGMQQLAALTDQAIQAIQAGDWRTLGFLMEQNFAVREQLYGKECLGASNLRMVEVGRQHGANVKFPGSGGAVLGLPGPSTDMESLRSQYQKEGCVVVEIIPHLPSYRTLLPL